jgi:hypothetical protein
MSDVKPEDFLFELLEKEQKQNKKLSWHLIHTKANWIEKGAQREQERIIKLIEETLLIHADQKFFLVRSIKGEQT